MSSPLGVERRLLWDVIRVLPSVKHVNKMVVLLIMSEAYNFASVVAFAPADLDYSIQTAESL